MATDFLEDMAFVYSGPEAVQTGLALEDLAPARVAVVRGRVLDSAGQPLGGVRVQILSHPEFGWAQSRSDGTYDMVVNGGGAAVVDLSADGHLPVQRRVTVPWHDWVVVPDAILLSQDARVTSVPMDQPAMLAARGSVVSDADGSRQGTILVPAGAHGVMDLPDGTTAPLPQMSLRVTEFTVGPRGPQAMPAELPPATGYTYAVDLTADEAITAGAVRLRFDRPLVYYVENFLDFPVGIPVPVGSYDRQEGVWKAEDDGRVLRVLAEDGGRAVLDLDGSGEPATPEALQALGVTDEERLQLASLYEPGQVLSRVAMTHFSAYDFNYGVGPLPDAVAPAQEDPERGLLDDLGDTFGGFGTVEALDQVLQEVLPLAGTPLTLTYRSDRVPGCAAGYSTTIPLSGDFLPGTLQRIELEVEVAGQVHRETFPPATRQRTTFTWDGLDAYGRPVQGARPARVRVGYVYAGFYLRPRYEMRNFGVPGGLAMPDLVPARQEFTMWQDSQVTLGTWDNRGSGLGGWTLSVQHAYDVDRGIVHLGDGGRIRLDRQEMITGAVGNGQGGLGGDGGPATEASFGSPDSVAVAPDGSLLVLGAYGRIRQVAPNGIISTVAGAGYETAEGIPAAQTGFWTPTDLAFGPDGSLYVCEYGGHRVRRIDRDGLVWTVAGSWGAWGYSGDGGPATEARLNSPVGIATGPDGSLYIADGGNRVVRRVSPDGTIHTVAGTENSETLAALAVNGDGTLYVGTTAGIQTVSRDGKVRHFAGGDSTVLDGALAVDTRFGNPGLQDLALGRAGEVYVVLYDYGYAPNVHPGRVVRRIEPDGRVFTVAGSVVSGNSGDGDTPRKALFQIPAGAAVGPDGSLYVADSYDNRVRRIFMGRPLQEGADLVVPSEDGGLLYRFDSRGRHLRTVNSLTGATLLEFEYSGDLLTGVVDASGNRLTVERDGSGSAQALVAPFGQRTILSMGAGGYLSAVTNPAGEAVRLRYGPGGLLTEFLDPLEASYRFTYEEGRLVQADHPGNGGITLEREVVDGRILVRATSATGLVSTSSFRRLSDGSTEKEIANPDGTREVSREALDQSGSATAPTGTRVNWTVGPDPRYGIRVPVLRTLDSTTPGGLVTRVTSSREAELDAGGDLLALTDTVAVNGRTSRVRFDRSSRTVTATSPAGRQASSTLDTLGRPLEVRLPQVPPVTYSYDGRGRPVLVRQGEGASARTTTLAYGADGNLDGSGNLIVNAWGRW